MKRLTALAMTALIALALGGCAMQTESRLDDYLAESQRMAVETAELVPDEPAAEVVDRGSEPRFGDTQTAEQKPSDPAWAQARSRIEWSDAAPAGTSEAGAGAIAQALGDDGWSESRVRETSEGARVTDGFRKEVDGEDWYIEVAWTTPDSGLAEAVDILVVSPATTRGDSTAVN